MFTLRQAEAEPVQTPEERAVFELILAIRAEAAKAAEPLRKAGSIGHSLDTHLTFYARSGLLDEIKEMPGLDLREIFIVSDLGFDALDNAQDNAHDASDTVEGLKILVAPAPGEKCARCWIYSQDLGTNADHPGLCPRCAAVVAAIEARESCA